MFFFFKQKTAYEMRISGLEFRRVLFRSVFGSGSPSAEALNFVNTTSTRDEKAEEFVALASVAGDLSQLFELPGGPIGFALGAEYREERASSAYEPMPASGGPFLNAIPVFEHIGRAQCRERVCQNV